MKTTAFDCRDLIRLFEACFYRDYNTRLIAGGDEPVYLPADAHNPSHRIIFTRDYFASALHEIAHWCIAGEARRQQQDYGYWYCPDGRDASQQAAFEKVEIRPQALEWAFNAACGSVFRVSTDNLDGSFEPDRAAFTARVKAQLLDYLAQGFPPRAGRFIRALCHFYQRPWPLNRAMIEETGK